MNAGQEDAFVDYKAEFLPLLLEQEGTLENLEFEIVSENDQNLAVGMSVYASQEAFMGIANGGLMQNSVAISYFGTFTPVASQYAVSTTNTN